MSRSDLFEANLAGLERASPWMAKALRELHPATSLIDLDDGDVDLDLGDGRRLYDQGARAYARDQVALYQQSPNRIGLNRPKLVNVLGVNRAFLVDLLEELSEGRGFRYGDQPGEMSSVLVVFGLGLGFHIPQLIEKFAPKMVIVIEEHLEFFYHSCCLIDWTPYFVTPDDQGTPVSFLIDPVGEVLAHGVLGMMRPHSYAWDSTHLYRHFRSRVLDLAYDEVLRSGDKLVGADGYFEDELYMLQNGFANFYLNDLYILKKRVKIMKGVPAFVVASGPSIDYDLENIKKFREKVVIFSAGSGLGVCLNNGIRPDFHCELENEPTVPRLLGIYKEKFGFDGITLIAPQTVSPDAYAMFERRIALHRGGVTPERLFRASDEEDVNALIPLVSNVAVVAASLLGFHEVYLFGVDLGARYATQHHSKSSAYFEVDYLNIKEVDLPDALPGNFGGTIKSERMYIWSRINLDAAARDFSRIRYFNCGRGAAINGYQPLPSSTISITSTRAQRDAAIATIFADDVQFELAGHRIAGRMPSDIAECVHAKVEEIRGLIAGELASESPDVWRLARQVSRIVTPSNEAQATSACCARGMMTGSTKIQLAIWFSFRNRLHPEDDLELLDRLALGCLDRSVVRLDDIFTRYADKLRSMLESGRFEVIADMFFQEGMSTVMSVLTDRRSETKA